MNIQHSSIGIPENWSPYLWMNSEENDNIDGYPEWQQDMIIKAKEVIRSDDYLPLPSKFDIHEYHIMEEFCCSVGNDNIRGILLDKIKGRGAFGRFKNAIRMNGIEEEWYRFRQEELEKIAINWLEENEISYTKDNDRKCPTNSNHQKNTKE